MAFVSKIFSWFNQWLKDEEGEVENITHEDLMKLFKLNEVEDHFMLTEVRKMECTECKGIITHVTDKAATIDNDLMFNLEHCNIPNLKVGSKVVFKLYKNKDNNLVRNVSLDTEIHDNELIHTNKKVYSHNINDTFEVNGYISNRFTRDIQVRITSGLDDTRLSFSLNNVCAEFIPSVGDLVILYVYKDENRTVVERMMPATTVTRMGRITKWDEMKGTIGTFATFTCLTCEPGYQPQLDDKVFASLIKTTDKKYPWRAIQVIPQGKHINWNNSTCNEETDHLEKQSISIDHIPKIKINLSETKKFKVKVTNTSGTEKILENCCLFSMKEHSQLNLTAPCLDAPIHIKPFQSLEFLFSAKGLFLGRSTEIYVWIFKSFKIRRSFELEVIDTSIQVTTLETNNNASLPKKEITAKELLERNSGVIIPGRRSFSPAAFVPVKLGPFALPESIIKIALPHKKLSLDNHMIEVEKILPDLKNDLGTDTYLSRMHNLLFLEEAAMLKQVAELKMERASFIVKQNCLILKVPPLSPYTTKLVAGDKLIATLPNPDLNNPTDMRKYEGIIHKVTQTELWLQFCEDFHNLFNLKKKFSVSFETSRASLRRMHQAVNLAAKHLGMDWLFPSCVKERVPQVVLDEEEIEVTNNESLEKELQTLLGKKQNELQRYGRTSSHLENLKYLRRMMKKKENNKASSQELSFLTSPQLSSIEIKLHSADPRKHTAHLQEASRPEMIKQNIPISSHKAHSWKSHLKDIPWNRQGSGYGKYCTVDNEHVVKNVNNHRRRKIRWFNSGLNKQQKDTVRNVLLGIARPLPYIIFGPPGTGKTVTVVETILQLHALVPESRLLVATPSNSAADLITQRLIEPGILKQKDLMRLVGYHYLEQGRIPPDIAPYSSVPDVKAINLSGTTGSSYEGVQMCSRELLGRHRITVGTLGCLGLLYNMGFPRGHFTHVIIDEAGQATEPEVLIPMIFLHMEFGQVVLAGDPLQLGPVVTSRLASHYGLQDSLLARLLDRFPYTRDPDGFPETNGYDPRLVTKLIHNYRSLPMILNLTSMMFYDNDLIANVSDTNSEEAQVLQALSKSLPCTEPGRAIPMLFHGVRGQNLQEKESHSWYNPEEVVQVTKYLNILYQVGLRPHDLGIITPYQLQSNKIRLLLESMHTEAPKVGSVEEFQGQEKLGIIVSIVRSNQDEINSDMQRALGFVANGRRLNVALTRARAVLIILGNPHLLCLDTHWRTVLTYCIKHNAYIGCDLPEELLAVKTAITL